MSQTTTRAQIIHAPSREPIRTGNKTVFLAGSTNYSSADTDWRTILTSALASQFQGLTILNPYRPDWDGWVEDESCAPFREQVVWELDMQDRADLVVVYFHPLTQAAVSLLELGLNARGSGQGNGDGGGESGGEGQGSSRNDRVLVVCPDGYWKRGNVSIVCRRFGIEMVASDAELRDAVVRKLSLGEK